MQPLKSSHSSLPGSGYDVNVVRFALRHSVPGGGCGLPLPLPLPLPFPASGSSVSARNEHAPISATAQKMVEVRIMVPFARSWSRAVEAAPLDDAIRGAEALGGVALEVEQEAGLAGVLGAAT